MEPARRVGGLGPVRGDVGGRDDRAHERRDVGEERPVGLGQVELHRQRIDHLHRARGHVPVDRGLRVVLAGPERLAELPRPLEDAGGGGAGREEGADAARVVEQDRAVEAELHRRRVELAPVLELDALAELEHVAPAAVLHLPAGGEPRDRLGARPVVPDQPLVDVLHDHHVGLRAGAHHRVHVLGTRRDVPHQRVVGRPRGGRAGRRERGRREHGGENGQHEPKRRCEPDDRHGHGPLSGERERAAPRRE